MTTENQNLEDQPQDQNQDESGASEEITPSDILDMDPDELAKSLEDGEDGPDDEGITDESSSEEETDEESDDSTTDDESAEEDDDSTISDDDDDGDAEGEDDQKSGDPLKDTQRAFHKANAEKKKLMEENAELRRRNLELTKPLKPDQLTDKELEDMKVLDPGRYAEVMIARSKYEEDVKVHDEKVEQHEAQSAAENEELANEASLYSLAAAATELLGFDDAIDPSVPFDQQPEEYRQLLQSKELTATMEMIDKNPERFYEADGSVSMDTILLVHRGLHHKSIEANGRVKGQQQALDNIKKARGQGSKHDKVGKGPAGGKSRKGIENLTQGEIHDMDPAQLDSYYKDAQAQGLL